jgi:hypothetical protein
MKKQELLDTLRAERTRLENALAALTEAQITKQGANGDWSVKDVIAHIVYWEQTMLKNIETGLRGETLTPGGETVDAINARAYKESQDRPLADILADFRQSYQQVVDKIESLPENSLNAPTPFNPQSNTRLWKYIAGESYDHYADHIAHISGAGAEERTGPRSKEELVERLAQDRARLWQTITPLSEAQLSAPPDSSGWAIKDHLVHLALWEKGMTALLQQKPRYAAMGLDEKAVFAGKNADDLNTIMFQQYKDTSAHDALETLRNEQAAFDRALAKLSFDDLYKTYSHYQPDEPAKDSGAPIVNWIAGNTFGHYLEHLAWIEALIHSEK